ncbi:MAG: hypothetical protein EA370_06110 [Wenzhouxiangella sp.]|nr:MAG: hypothetical protein EA370_06110 [Wenzhouxiangella sp.]
MVVKMNMNNYAAILASSPHSRSVRFASVLASVIVCAILLTIPVPGQGSDADAPATVGPVTEGQDLRSIAEENLPATDISIPQFMLAFVERNPDAFVEGNVNMIREGAMLNVPSADEARAISRVEAAQRLDEQMAWFDQLSEDERIALREIVDGDLVAMDPSDPIVEPEAVDPVPQPEAGLTPEEALDRAEAVPESAPVEAPPAPEPMDVVPEVEPTPETDVTIDDDVPEPDSVFDPASADPESELLPEPPERSPEEMFEPEPDPMQDRGADATVDEPSIDTRRQADLPASETDSAAVPAPPTPGIAPEPVPPTAAPWWTWLVGAGFLVLVLVVIFQIYRRR